MRSLSPDEIWDFFDAHKGWAILTTLGQDGFPHSVAIGYFRLEETLYCGCRDGSQKIRNIERNSKVSLLLESGRQDPPQSLQGIMFQGEARVIREPAEILEIKSALARRRGQPPPSEVNAGIAYIRIEPQKTISWSR